MLRRPSRSRRPRRSATRALAVPTRRDEPLQRWTASIIAQRTRRLPCLVIDPRCTVVSDSLWRGVSPAQEQSLSGEANRVMSPISTSRIAAVTGPMPGSI